jgi:hypothetical protein
MIGMKGSRNILAVVLIFASSSLFAQLQSLPEFYESLSFSQHVNNSDTRTSNYHPLKATHYIWNNSTWNFTDTTLIAYTATDEVASLTKKDNANNFTFRILSSYDASDNLTEELHQSWSSGWVNNFRDTSAFDIHNNLTLQENHQWNTNQWVRMGGYRYFYTYNAGGKFLTKLTVSWNTGTLAWDSVSRITNSYNANNQVVQTIGESFNMSSTAWELISKRDYTYNASFVNTQTTDYLWNSSVWVNNTQLLNIVWSTWTGDVNTSDPQTYVYQLWSGSSWDNYNRLTYTYDAFGSVIQLTELFVTGNWRNDARLSEFYDNQYNYTGIRSESWNIFTTAWDTLYEYKYNYTYDVNNTIMEEIYQEYDVLNHIFQNETRAVYSDFILLGVADIAGANSAVRIYPNPVVDFLNVIMPAEMQGHFTYSIYDSAGKLIRTGEGKNDYRIKRAGLAEGLYLLHITGGQGANYILKFVVQ